MAESDGRLPAKSNSPPLHAGNFKRVKTGNSSSRTNSGVAAAMLVEQKHKKPHSGNRSRYGPSNRKDRDDIRCFNCQQTGHYARNCLDKQGRDRTVERLQGSAATALHEDSARSIGVGWNRVLIDSGASFILTGRMQELTCKRTIDPPVRVTVADGRVVHIKTVGVLDIRVVVRIGRDLVIRVLSIQNVYHVPTLSLTLLSVSQLVHSANIVRFADNEWSVLSRKRAEIIHAKEANGVYEVHTPDSGHISREPGSDLLAALRTNVSMTTWHRRFGNLNIADCRRLATTGAVRGVVISQGADSPVCRSCALAKVTTATVPRVRSSSAEVAQGICHIDLSGPVKRSYHGSEYFMVLVWRDFIKVYGLHSKDGSSSKVTEFLKFIERQAKVPVTSITTVRTDGGTEFMGADFRKLVAEEGLHHQHTTRYRSSQNGVAERAIRTVTEMTVAMMLDSHLPHYLWEDALRHAAYIRNRIPKRHSSNTPDEQVFRTKPSLEGIPIVGQAAVVRTPEPMRRKNVRFDGRGSIGGFVGFSDEIRGYRVYIHARPIKETTDVVMLDTMLVDEVVLDDNLDTPITEQDSLEAREDTTASQLSLSRGSTLQNRENAAARLRDTSLTQVEVERANGTSQLTSRRRSERISAQWSQWEHAIHTELKALEDNGTFDLVDHPEGAHILGNTVQFRVKTGPDGKIVQFKARVCARGDKQVFLVDYFETRSPVADLVCVHIFFIAASKYKMVIRQGDVPAAYLKATLKETMYVRQVKGFEVPGQESKVWRLRKALY